MANYKVHAKREFSILKANPPKDPMENFILPYEKPMMEILEIFSKQGHSGMSAGFGSAILSDAIKNMLMFEPMSPITGEDHEWADCNHDEKDLWQNNRCFSIFKNGKNGRARFANAIVFRTPKGVTYISGGVQTSTGRIGSSQLIKKFPFIPKTFYIDVLEVELKPDDWVFSIKNEEDLKPVFEYYDRLEK